MAIPTLEKILNDGGSIVLMSHLGRPNDEPNKSDGSDMDNAIQCLKNGIENKELQKPSIGCNIKWK